MTPAEWMKCSTTAISFLPSKEVNSSPIPSSRLKSRIHNKCRSGVSQLFRTASSFCSLLPARISLRRGRQLLRDALAEAGRSAGDQVCKFLVVMPSLAREPAAIHDDFLPGNPAGAVG